jgi:NAD(P)-dependent dehydrogenase (short-subunit alcohol dehydrogenase family)
MRRRAWRSHGSPIPGSTLLFRGPAARATVVDMTPDTTTPTQRIALVTGGSRGIGRAAALSLAAEGVDVVITYRAAQEAAADVVAAVEAQGRRAVALELDTTDTASFAAFAATLRAALAGGWDRDTFDVLVNNAGTSARAPFTETTEAQFDEMIAVHVKGVYFLTQTLLPLLADGATIVNVSTGLTRFAFPGLSAYAAAKGAVEVLTRHWALELGPRGITVNTVAPGAIETDFGGGLTRDNPEVNAAIAAVTALGRAGLPEDIGPAIAGLVTHAGHWITGQRIEASGGTHV